MVFIIIGTVEYARIITRLCNNRSFAEEKVIELTERADVFSRLASAWSGVERCDVVASLCNRCGPDLEKRPGWVFLEQSWDSSLSGCWKNCGCQVSMLGELLVANKLR